MSKTDKVQSVVGKLGWASFAVYLVASVCGQEKVQVLAGASTVTCAAVVNGMKVVREINTIIKA